MNSKFDTYFCVWFSFLILGLATFEYYTAISIFLFLGSFIVGALMFNEFQKRKQSKNSVATITKTSVPNAQPETPKAKEPVHFAATSDKPGIAASGAAPLQSDAEFISSLCLALGATPDVDRFIALKKFSIQDGAVFRYALWIFHLTICEWWLVQQRR